ncbi:TetR/AcrR family transcriptional regulator [Catenulispora yoronensis]|uniref:TetR/AcrR family transcriptional regulator n=1 Tax=Catenulispora yoronensis TaxID=450799 RepID=A0ABP5FDH3_9ACTN
MPKVVNHAARRAELTEALWRVALRDGFDAVTVRSVAQEAGWSPGALRHYFPDKAEMVLFAMDLVAQESAGRIQTVYEGHQQATPETIQQHLEQLLPLDATRRIESEVWFALVTLAHSDARVAERRTQIDDMIRESVRSIVTALEQIGRLRKGRDPELEARRLHALLDGLVIQLMAEPPRVGVEEAREVIAQQLADLTG